MTENQNSGFHDEQKQKLLNELSESSPFDVINILQSIELYDKKDADVILKELSNEINKSNKVEQIVKPVVCSVIDGLFELIPAAPRQLGVTSQRIVEEVWNFKYDTNMSEYRYDGYVEYKNMQQITNRIGGKFAEEHRNTYDRSKYENKNSMDKYKDESFKKESTKNITDEYTGERNITRRKDAPDGRRNDPTNRYQAQPDHIIPLKEIYERLRNNYSLSNSDIKRISNIDDNFAMTSAKINQSKQDLTNSEFVNDTKLSESLTDEAKKNMKEKEKKANKAIDNEVNKTVGKNIFGQGNIDEEMREFVKQYKEEHGGKAPAKEERDEKSKELRVKKTGEVWGKLSAGAGIQTALYVVGDIILFILKPFTFEIKDIIQNGISEGVSLSDTAESIKFRFFRIKQYIVQQVIGAFSSFKSELLSLIKKFISLLVEGIIQLFRGFLKNLFKIVKEGFIVFVKAVQTLRKQDISSAQKGDAIVKLIGGSLFGLVGIGLDALLHYVSVPAPVSQMLSTMFSGILSAMFMYLLDRIDLFNTKNELYIQRVDEIFKLRIGDINYAASTMRNDVIKAIENKKSETEKFLKGAINAINANDINSINQSIGDLSLHFGINLPYNTLEEFVTWVEKQEKIDFVALSY